MDLLKLEIIIYLFIAIALSVFRRIVMGWGHAAFYAKSAQKIDPRIQKYVDNYHFVATPEWYTSYYSFFFVILAVCRLLSPTLAFGTYIVQLITAILITMGSSGLGNYWYQGFINISCGLPFDDPNENKQSEFALGKYHFWWPDLAHRHRKIATVISGVFVIVGLYLMFK